MRTIYQSSHKIPCTACRYCTERCPMEIPIPELFAQVNEFRAKGTAVDHALVEKSGDCVKCGACAACCPQHLEIPTLLESIRKEF